MSWTDDDAASATGAPRRLRVTVVGNPGLDTLVLVGEDDPDLRKGFFFVSQMLDRGVYLHPWHNMFLCAAMTEADIDQALDAADGAFAALKQQAPGLAPVEKLAFLSAGQR